MTEVETPLAAPEGEGAGRRWLFVAAILTGSFLLFLVQPMVARMALPKLGGAPAVWNSAMLVYQALLLGGYAYAHWLSRVAPRIQGRIHLVVLLIAALWLPIGLIGTDLPQSVDPALWVPWLLVASIGPLFLAISAQAPLLQRWHASVWKGRDPYALYAASNIGSFGGLIAYPLIVEPLLPLQQQSWLWTSGYLIVLVLVFACSRRLPDRAAEAAIIASPAPPGRRVLHWIALAFVPSGLMLATTTFLTTDIVAVPLLWVLPLGLYLLSFPLAFRDGEFVPYLVSKLLPLVLLLFGATLISGHQEFAYLNAIIGLLLLFLVAVALHSRMYQLRPAPDRLTGFYLAMAVGGALGGVFAGLIAPTVFDWTYEYPLLILAAGALGPRLFLLDATEKAWSSHRQAKTIVFSVIIAFLVWAGLTNPGGLLGEKSESMAFVVVALLGVSAIGTQLPYMIALTAGLFLFGGYRSLELSLTDARTRSYFGVYTVSDTPDQRRLAHGTTLHGVQLKGARSRLPTTYYTAGSGVGQAMLAAPRIYGTGARIGVVGLGTGTLACYHVPGQRWRFYEIDPAVATLSHGQGRFTFLRQCAPDADIVIGDARMKLGQEQAGSFDLLALDAFSSDAVPMHLLTSEAFELYSRVVQPRGLLLVHISNRFLALSPVVAAAAQHGGWRSARLQHTPSALEQADEGTSSDWIALSRDPAVLGELMAGDADWELLQPRAGFSGWTDDYASVLAVMRAFNPSLKDD